MYKQGDVIEGKVTGIQNYGAFIIIDDYIGLVHISEISDGYVKDINNFLEVGKTYSFYCLESDEENKKLKLSYKRISDEVEKSISIALYS